VLASPYLLARFLHRRLAERHAGAAATEIATFRAELSGA
jgi:hypothetical protein